MIPEKWICQAKWIKIANIDFMKKNNVRICNPTIFTLRTLGVK